MQGKGLVRFFLILLSIICLYQLFFILPGNWVEDDATAYAEGQSAGLSGDRALAVYDSSRSAYLDSMTGATAFSLLGRDFTYADVKRSQVNLGLDLKGGMSAVLQVDLRSFLESLADGSTDPDFVAALNRADEELRSAQSDYITLFANAFVANGSGKKLAEIFADNETLRERLSFQSSDGEVIEVLRQEADETVELTYNLLRERIDRTGVIQPNVTLDESRDLITVELPGVENPKEAENLLTAAAALDFYDVYRNTDPGIFQGLVNANTALTAARDGESVEEVEEQAAEREFELVATYAVDDLGNIDSANVTGYDTVFQEGVDQDFGALFSLLSPQSPEFGASPVVGFVSKGNRKNLLEVFERDEFKSAFPRDVAFAIGQKPIENRETGENTNTYYVYALRTENGGEPALSGIHVTGADQSVDVQNGGEVQVNLEMDATGAQEWARITTERVGREFAIVLDGEVISAPTINQPITGGRSRITGGFTIPEAQDLALKLEVGRLPAEAQIIQQSIVGPTLGASNIRASIISLVVGFALVLLFMLAYYAGAGLVSIVALFANVFFIFGALASFGTVLTLPGIAGIVLTIGMAVDANVIIYERIREELRTGKTVAASIQDGFSNSLSAILDANITTLLTALVLSYFGLGPIKGFAVVLIIGILTSLFTAVLVTRLIISNRIESGKGLSFWTGFSENVLATVNVDWMAKRKVGYAISGALLVVSLGSILTRGFDLGVDFRGGYNYTVDFVGSTVDQETLTTALDEAFGSTTVVKAVDGSNRYSITTDYLVDETTSEAREQVEDKLFEGISTIQPGLDRLAFANSDLDDKTRIVSASKVGPTIADDIRASSFKAGIGALLLIFFYLFARFNRWEFSLGAVAALFHDAIITLGLFSLLHGLLPFSMEIDQAFIAAILTVIGYSVNDTVIVFDRIREYITTYTGRTKEEIFNLAINSTISRTLITSLTTLLVVLMLFLFGGDSIRGFAFALLIGIVVGTYSSIFVASASVNDLIKDITVKRPPLEDAAVTASGKSGRTNRETVVQA